ncbi:Nitronate monooxygenase [Bosea sp. 62]|uniref:NAD(P)H-dependent flavin oxidoreductase n=1 Tax=unclassified Bosea (in: a-proteobacteria) TaxID=2653178 RepID=UPI001255FCDB|nr:MULTISPECIES: nitronate monooxygenase family protein [unclassified Bosea (in: a-proteobacteria)]CAD5253741.1 Nitronate monooxygenase [Bosea sp. 21B]CAD5287116.1 Nitronate monooxygenase [Bosea sp. 7B]CAD5301197.1 Nitronate monooxygenase [Bosea sp. 46]VVT57329.1 Nitronate monooxygenase [Bosea sp. EC-HK365B]VXB65865.1 Nitronate monooxygenase [Bosea sp. 125]
MQLPAAFAGRLRVPVIAAPMFLISGPDLVVSCCCNGVVGSFPALNQRTTAGFADWLDEISERLGGAGDTAPFGVNLVVHRSNPRLEADLAVVIERKVPLVITSLGLNRDLIKAVHGYGGLVFHDVINLAFAAKAADAGVDGLIAVSAGAGGHAGPLNPFAALADIRRIFDGTLVLGGALSTGAQVAAARMAGADMAYLGTRFMATKESMAPQALRSMLLDASAADIVYTPAISGVHGNFLRPSIVAAGRDPDDFSKPASYDFGATEAKAWRDIWAAGQGVGTIDDLPAAADLCRRLADEYEGALAGAARLSCRVADQPVG